MTSFFVGPLVCVDLPICKTQKTFVVVLFCYCNHSLFDIQIQKCFSIARGIIQQKLHMFLLQWWKKKSASRMKSIGWSILSPPQRRPSKACLQVMVSIISFSILPLIFFGEIILNCLWFQRFFFLRCYPDVFFGQGLKWSNDVTSMIQQVSPWREGSGTSRGKVGRLVEVKGMSRESPERLMYHANPQPSFLGVITHIYIYWKLKKPSFLHGFGVQGYNNNG